MIGSCTSGERLYTMGMRMKGKNRIRAAIVKAYKASDMTLRQLGEKADVNYQHLGRYISGRPMSDGRRPADMPTEKADRVMRALGIGDDNGL